MQDFLRNIAACENVLLNQDILGQIVNNDLDVSRVIALGMGLDYKTHTKDSKIKCYLMVREYPEKVDQVLALHPPLDGIRDYLIHEDFMFGIDMYFDGRTGIEIYPFFNLQDLNNAPLMDKLKLRYVIEKIKEKCNLLHVSFDGGGRRVLHLNPQSPTKFVRSIGNRQLTLSYGSVQILNYFVKRSYHKEAVVMITLREDEILSENIRNVNLQYSLSYKS